jgi:putative transposase
MARLPRLALAGQPHHVVLQGHSRDAVFLDDQDRTAFLTMLGEAARSQGVALHAYALLDDAVHWLATPAEAPALGRLVQAIGRRYVAAFNRRHGRRGTLWDGRFRSSLVEAQAALVDVTVLIERLPVTAGVAAHAADWAWSSAAHHLGRRRDPLVTEHPAYWKLGNTPFERELAHAHKLDEGVPPQREQELLQALRQGHPVGSATFLAKLAEIAGRPMVARSPGRPRKTVPEISAR